MNFDESFPKRVSIARNAMGLTQSDLAKKVGIVPRQIAAYEGGEARPRANALRNLAAALGTTVEWLTTGSGMGPDTSRIKRTVTVREVPLLTYAQVSGEGFDFDDFRNSSSASDFIAAPQDAGEFSFAIEVNGNSMEAPSGPSFPDGTIIIVDPETMPESGDFALFVDLATESITFKQYVVDQGHGYLRPLNPAYPSIQETASISAIGKVISAQQTFKNKKNHQPFGHDLELSKAKILSMDVEALHKQIHNLDKKIDNIIDMLSSKKPT